MKDYSPEHNRHKICDYTDTDYAAFWDNTQREYEDAVERIALRRLTKGMTGTCVEIGAGFGRLVSEYAHLCTSVTLTDYAENMIVIRTVSGMAMAVAAALDNMDIQGFMGCIAGDDTIFCVARSSAFCKEIIAEIRKIASDDLLEG